MIFQFDKFDIEGIINDKATVKDVAQFIDKNLNDISAQDLYDCFFRACAKSLYLKFQRWTGCWRNNFRREC